jgi:hypothetical protein
MRMTARRTAVVAGGLLAAVVMVPTASAMATTVYAFNGDGERVATAWAPAAGDAGKVAVRDESAGNWVKAEYYRARSNDKRTLWNKSGAGRTVYSAHGAKVIKLQACEDIDWGRDHCSGWKWVD